MKKFRLYGTSACHLCELAQGMIASEQLTSSDCDVEEVDISGSDALFERYGVTIPVLQNAQGRELNWPFSASQLRDFMAS